jgi:hypothetical protein
MEIKREPRYPVTRSNSYGHCHSGTGISNALAATMHVLRLLFAGKRPQHGESLKTRSNEPISKSKQKIYRVKRTKNEPRTNRKRTENEPNSNRNQTENEPDSPLVPVPRPPCRADLVGDYRTPRRPGRPVRSRSATRPPRYRTSRSCCSTSGATRRTATSVPNPGLGFRTR